MENQHAPHIANGWNMQLINGKLSISSESEPEKRISLPPQVTYDLLIYLLDYRDEIYLSVNPGHKQPPTPTWYLDIPEWAKKEPEGNG
jgi:hypothetical protein